jgi:hypothetical protein
VSSELVGLGDVKLEPRRPVDVADLFDAASPPPTLGQAFKAPAFFLDQVGAKRGSFLRQGEVAAGDVKLHRHPRHVAGNLVVIHQERAALLHHGYDAAGHRMTFLGRSGGGGHGGGTFLRATAAGGTASNQGQHCGPEDRQWD